MSQTTEQVIAELWPIAPNPNPIGKAKRCNAGTRKRVCKKDGQEVIDCFDPCSSSPASGGHDGKKLLKQKEVTIRTLNTTIKKLKDDRQTYLNMLKERDTYIEAFKKREHKTMKSMKKANTTIKELVTEPLKCRADLKKYREKLNEADMNIHNVMSTNTGLQNQNQILLNKFKELNTRYSREKNEKIKCAGQLSALKNELAECHKQLRQCLEQQANPDSFGESSSDEASSDESEDSHTAAAAAAAASRPSHTAAAAAAAAPTSRTAASKKSAGNKLREKFSKR
jgi:DNA repair exonuclease SbcCD ATPase subunit